MKCNQLGCFVALFLAAGPAPGAMLYVDLNSSNPTPPYMNWATAATNIQDAVDAAVAGDEILVTNGIYTRGGRALGTNLLVNRVLVDKPLTLRSVNGPEVTVIRGFKLPTVAGCGDGAIRCVSLANGASLTGFTLTNGATRTEGDPQLELSGGGVWCESQTTVVSNCVVTGNGGCYGGGAAGGTLYSCTLTNNSAVTNGGGAYGSALKDCSLIRNSARLGAGGGACASALINCSLSNNLASARYGWGGGVSESTLDNCALSGNSAGYGGGAFYSTLRNCTLANNSASFQGGGASYGTLNNCKLTGNSAYSGGGAYSGTLVNCTVVGNSAASDGGGVADDWSWDASDNIVTNCIVYYNNSATNGPNYSYNSLRCCCTTPMPAFSSGNITNAPLFVDYAGGNLRLQSNSPCINAGDNAAVAGGIDLDGRPRIVGGTVDIGAYEFQPGVSGEFMGWLSDYGLPTDGSADFADSDNDLLNNWQEWIAGTIPTDASSALSLLNPTNNGAGIVVTWQSVSNRTYFLERVTNLGLQRAFSLVTSNIIGQAGTTSYMDTTTTGSFFYRVGIQQ